jgi:hypothetical protein
MAGGSDSPDAPRNRPLEWVKITHPAHPLRGKTFEVISEVGRVQKGQEILIELENGERRTIPLDWTERKQAPESSPGVRFDLDHLMLLRRRVSALLASGEQNSIMPLESKQLDSGGLDEDADCRNDMGAAEPGTTGSAGSDTCADPVTVLGSGKRRGGS